VDGSLYSPWLKDPSATVVEVINYPLMITSSGNSIKALDHHDSMGVADASVTVESCVSKAQDVKVERMNLRPRMRNRSDIERKGTVGFNCPRCDRVFDSERGLKMHITRWCKRNSSGAGDRTPLAAHSQDDSPAQNHMPVIWSYALTHAESKRPGADLENINSRSRLRLPNASDKRKWKELDDAIYKKVILSVTKSELLKGRLDDVFMYFTDAVYNAAAQVVGIANRSISDLKSKQSSVRSPKILRQLKLAKKLARKQLRKVKRENGDVLSAHKALMLAVRAYSDLLKSTNRERKERKESDERKRFLSDPHKYAKNLLAPPNKGKPSFSKDLADEYFRVTYADKDRSYHYVPPPNLPRPAQPLNPFDTSFVSFDEFSRICYKKSNGSAPGPNGIPYLLYKCCGQVRQLLWSLLKRVWDERVIPKAFQLGRVRLLAKSDDTSHPKLMRPISILNAEGRLFWTVFQLRLSRYMLSNKYIEPHIQKGFLEGVAGCVEHTTSQWEMLLNAKQNQRSITMAWLDLENAYGSVRHMLVQFALKWYFVPQAMSELLFRYYDGIFLKVITDEWSSDYFHLGIGVPQGCTASTIIFDVAFQVVLDYWKHNTKAFGPRYTFSGADLSISCPTYADDIELVASTPPQCQTSVDVFVEGINWTKTLKVKPAKCRSLAFRMFHKGTKSEYKQVLPTQYSSFDPLLTVCGAPIKFIGNDDPPIFKYLGFQIQFDLQDTIIKDQVEQRLLKWLDIIDNAPLDGRMQAWITNFYVCSKLAWVLMVQNFSDTTVQAWQNHINRYYRKWVGLAKSAEPSILYRSHEHFGLKFKDLKQVQQQLRIIKWHLMKYSKVAQSQELYRYRLKLDQQGHIGQGRTSSPCLTLERLERSCILDKVSGAGQHGRQGLGSHVKVKRLGPRDELIARLKKEAEEKRLLILHNYEMQASWLSWGLDRMMARDLSWSTLLYNYSQRLLKFMANAQLNTLPTPDNLKRWNLTQEAVCGLCGEKAVSLSHVLAGCNWVRQSENKLPREDRFSWRHNNVLSLLASVIRKHLFVINKKKPVAVNGTLINFVKAGQAAKPQHGKVYSMLNHANDWCCDFDLPEWRSAGSAYVFPFEVCATPLKMDGYVLSRNSRICFGIELTCPMEENIEKWHQSKLAKYENEISSEAKKNGWRFYSIIIEVGARGWVPTSTLSALTRLGLPAAKSLANRLSFIALKSSYIIWLNRFNQDFRPWRLSERPKTQEREQNTVS
jgi:Reverse transcriptase (RNA-dependent DNA polymerase).